MCMTRTSMSVRNQPFIHEPRPEYHALAANQLTILNSRRFGVFQMFCDAGRLRKKRDGWFVDCRPISVQPNEGRKASTHCRQKPRIAAGQLLL
jgi:hypothetical protein